MTKQLIIRGLYRTEGRITKEVAKKYIESHRKTGKKLNGISLKENVIPPEGMEVISQYIQDHNTIKFVDVSNISSTMTQEQMLVSWELLFKALEKSPVATLIIGDNAISPNISTILADYIKKMKNLQHLIINNAGLGYMGITSIGNALIEAYKSEEPLKINTLILGQNRLMEKGGKILVNLIKEMSRDLETVWIHENSLPDKIMNEIIEVLGGCLKLKSLNFQDNHISKESSGKLAESYSNWKHLQYLNLNDNRLSRNGVMRLLKSIGDSDNQLKELHLQFCSVTKHALKYLIYAIIKTPTLKIVDITENEISPKTSRYKRLVDVLTKTKRLGCIKSLLKESQDYGEYLDEYQDEYEDSYHQEENQVLDLAKDLDLLVTDPKIEEKIIAYEEIKYQERHPHEEDSDEESNSMSEEISSKLFDEFILNITDAEKQELNSNESDLSTSDRRLYYYGDIDEWSPKISGGSKDPENSGDSNDIESSDDSNDIEISDESEDTESTGDSDDTEISDESEDPEGSGDSDAIEVSNMKSDL